MKPKLLTALSLCVLLLNSCETSESGNFSKEIMHQQILQKSEPYAIESVDTYAINYKSDGLNIQGFIAKPNDLKKGEKLPVIIFCRGGNQSLGMLNAFQLKMINELASKGFVVLASQLRGNMTSEGKDEFGGKDLNDILKLIDIAADIDFADETNIGVLGYSRGGMNTYQLATKSKKIKAIATVGAPTNIFSWINFRPNMYEIVCKPLFRDTISNKKEYIKRSPIYWHKKIKQPTLVLHGKYDRRVDVSEAIQLVDSFKLYSKKNLKYQFFSGGNHSLTNYKEERDALIINWFKTHLQ